MLMNANCFIDTNILIYCYTDTEPIKRAIAQKVASNPSSFISLQVINEFINTLHKKFTVNWDDILIAFSEVKNNFNIHINNATTIELACHIAHTYQYAFYDSSIIAASIQCGCKILYSEDMQHQQVIEKSLTIINPFVESDKAV